MIFEEMVAVSKDICDELGIEYSKNISFNVNSRLTATWGYCKRKRDGSFVISIAKDLVEADTDIWNKLDTIVHEILHTVDFKSGHRGKWKECANLVNAHYPELNIQTCTICEEKGIAHKPANYKYKVICNSCAEEFMYKRKPKIWLSLDKGTCTCPTCKGHSFSKEVL